jgi:hypothetical protein
MVALNSLKNVSIDKYLRFTFDSFFGVCENDVEVQVRVRLATRLVRQPHAWAAGRMPASSTLQR